MVTTLENVFEFFFGQYLSALPAMAERNDLEICMMRDVNKMKFFREEESDRKWSTGRAG